MREGLSEAGLRSFRVAARDRDVLEATLARGVTAELLDTIAGAGPPPDSRARPPA